MLGADKLCIPERVFPNRGSARSSTQGCKKGGSSSSRCGRRTPVTSHSLLEHTPSCAAIRFCRGIRCRRAIGTSFGITPGRFHQHRGHLNERTLAMHTGSLEAAVAV